jgi:hypothetical protein
MLGTFDEAHPVNLSFPCLDEAGRSLTVTAASYRIVDEVGTEILALTPVGGFTSGDDKVDITVSAVQNTLNAGQVEAIRKVIVEMTTASGVYPASQLYVIQSETPLVAGENSIQTYEQAILTMRHVYELNSFPSASEEDQRKALVEAYEAMSPFRIRTVDMMIGVNARAGSGMVSGEQNFIGDLTSTDIDALDSRLSMALRKAQVVQADFLLTALSTERLQRDGVQSQTVGESSQFFSPRAPLKMPVCRKALEILGPWIVWSVKLGRG